MPLYRWAQPLSEISSYAELRRILADLHDCPFDVDQSKFEQGTSSWRGQFLRPLWDSPAARHKGLPFIISWSHLPVVEAILKIEGVRSVSVTDKARIGRYTFNEPERVDGGIRLHFDPELTIDLELFGEVRGSLEEQSAPGLVALYRQVFLVPTGPVIKSVGTI